ncbi:class F sortase [Streptomyces sp. DH24]|uniref:class F sortase n=1 Tax=Streptomyces sp. DH24 TaxID=3040123 RepID=UPI002442ABAD|nr:class F sortase [Streptomyces sp. DH24]MDG9718106.1 class F sortase [Streptomyces sp. DH24]
MSRTRAYRLTRTVLVTGCLVAGGVWWAQDDEPGAVAAAPGPAATRPDGTSHAAERVPARTAAPAAPPGAGPKPPAAPSARPRPPAAPRPLPPSRATRLWVPHIGVDAPVMGLELDAQRRMTAPPDDDPNLVGWYEGGPTPGENGTAVAVGHLDTMKGPAVFAGLGELTPGRRIEVRRADERTAVYTVDAVKSYEKDDFPDEEVYGHRGRPELRLITCGGTYDRREGYSGNVVVFAHLTQVRDPGRAHPAD